MAKIAGKKHSIANLRSAMEKQDAPLAERRKAAKQLHELGLISDEKLDKFQARSAIVNSRPYKAISFAAQ